MVTILHISDLHFTRDAVMHTMRFFDSTLRVWDPSAGECLDVLETTEVDVSHMDFSDAILTEDVARLLWHGRATISDADYERYVKPYRKPYKNDGQRHG